MYNVYLLSTEFVKIDLTHRRKEKRRLSEKSKVENRVKDKLRKSNVRLTLIYDSFGSFNFVAFVTRGLISLYTRILQRTQYWLS